jgi:hypothetical protein
MVKLTLAGLSSFGIQMDSAIEGLIVSAAKPTNRKNVFQLQLQDKDGKISKHAFCGAKSIDEGLLGEENGQVFIQPGFETYTNAENEVWIRNKANASKKLAVL